MEFFVIFVRSTSSQMLKIYSDLKNSQAYQSNTKDHWTMVEWSKASNWELKFKAECSIPNPYNNFSPQITKNQQGNPRQGISNL